MCEVTLSINSGEAPGPGCHLHGVVLAWHQGDRLGSSQQKWQEQTDFPALDPCCIYEMSPPETQFSLEDSSSLFGFPFPGLSCHSAALRNKINRNVIPTVNCRFCRRRCVYTREQRIGGREETGGTACKKRENGKNGTDNIWASFQRTLRDKQ